MKTLFRILLLATVALRLTIQLQGAASTFVDENGVMRWTTSREEVALFGVNYTAPFAHAYRAHKSIGITWEQAIDADVYHLARLGFDAYRIHVWDREISDPDGNLVVNDHVRAFDYLLAKLKARGIKSIITPLQFGDAGYPSIGEPLIGFSNKYGKKGCLEDKTSWPLQERYLSQFVSHVNPATGLAYKDDPDVIAFEICNEPGHFDYALTVEYINRMAKAIRDTGCEKPIFYNMSHGLSVFKAYLDANVQGGTFQWYPSNLVANHEQRGNFLPYVDDYPIPFATDPKFRTKAKMIYEFDTADIGRSYLYPAMARTFRKAGMQFATQFAYDPMNIAPFNTEYRTHYLNLAYAPQKALSMKIAGEAFHRVPLHEDYGEYPANTQFAGVRVSYEEDLAELVTDKKFFHTNHTATKPPSPQSLEHIAGYGSSPIISYPGQGAYFLDRLESGVWRLEVMPDAIWVRDPFERASLKKSVCRIAWNEWPMQIDLPDLGSNFSASGLNDGNEFKAEAAGQTLKIRPGTYLLTRQGVSTKWNREDKWDNIALKEFVAPKASIDRTYVLHKPLVEVTAGQNLKITATIVSPQAVKKVSLVAYLPKATAPQKQGEQPQAQGQPGRGNGPGRGIVDLGGAQTFEMTQASGLEYSVEIPAAQITAGPLLYHIAVEGPAGYTSFPSETKALPTDWDFFGEGWKARIVAAHAPILLFDAAADSATITAQSRDLVYDLVPSDRPGTSAMEVIANNLDRGEHDHSFRYFFRDKINGRISDLAATRKIVLYGRSATDEPCELQVALVTTDGIAYGGRVTVRPEHGSYSVPVSALHKVRAPNLPHGYPAFIHFWSSLNANIPLDLNRTESVLVSIGPGMPASDYNRVHGVQIERIWLE
jgi:hypothetical protein